MAEKDSRLERAGVSGFNKPKRTPSHPKKSHVVVAKVGDKIKTINVKALRLDTERTYPKVKCQQHTGLIEKSGKDE